MSKKKDININYKPFTKSNSHQLLLKNNFKIERKIFEEEENTNVNNNIEEEIQKLHKINDKIQDDGYDIVEENIQHIKPKKHLSTKSLSIMDPVLEENEIQVNDENKGNNFTIKKIKLLKDIEEDLIIPYDKKYSLIQRDINLDDDKIIKEDNQDNDEQLNKIDIPSIKRIPEFIDLYENNIDDKKSYKSHKSKQMIEKIIEFPELEEEIFENKLVDIINEEKKNICNQYIIADEIKIRPQNNLSLSTKNEIDIITEDPEQEKIDI